MQRDRQEIQEGLWRAIESGDHRMIRAMIMNGADVDARDEQGRTAFQIATQRGDSEAAWIVLAARNLKYNMKLGMPEESVAPQKAKAQRRPLTEAREGKAKTTTGKLARRLLKQKSA